MRFPRQEYWSGLPFPSPGDLPDPEIKPRSPELQADSLLPEVPGKPSNYFQVKALNHLFSYVSHNRASGFFSQELGKLCPKEC